MQQLLEEARKSEKSKRSRNPGHIFVNARVNLLLTRSPNLLTSSQLQHLCHQKDADAVVYSLFFITQSLYPATMMLLLFLFSLLCVDSTAFSPFHAPKLSQSGAAPTSCTLLFASDKKKKNLFEDNGDNLFSNNNDKDEDPKLGIDIGKMLEPLTPKQAQELRAEASEMIADKVAKGIDDIQDLRKQLTREVEKERNQRLMKSERDAAQASKRLLSKIDSLTSDFMSTSESMRKSTKLAAAVDRANEGKGVELGSWGSLGGVSVATGGGGLLGSVASSEVTTTQSTTSTTSISDNEESFETAPKENRIIMIADPSQVC
jgi:hypothetical protein